MATPPDSCGPCSGTADSPACKVDVWFGCSVPANSGFDL